MENLDELNKEFAEFLADYLDQRGIIEAGCQVVAPDVIQDGTKAWQDKQYNGE